MNLSYRGVKYSVEPTTIKTVEGDIVGQYRGQAYRFKQVADATSVGNQVSGLRYRGAIIR